MKKGTIVIIAVVAILALWGITGYNGLVTQEEKVETEWAQVETQY